MVPVLVSIGYGDHAAGLTQFLDRLAAVLVQLRLWMGVRFPAQTRRIKRLRRPLVENLAARDDRFVLAIVINPDLCECVFQDFSERFEQAAMEKVSQIPCVESCEVGWRLCQKDRRSAKAARNSNFIENVWVQNVGVHPGHFSKDGVGYTDLLTDLVWDRPSSI
jgi:hypothetical protein